eukprot:5748120-Karenia_brevis.AAC.1
MNLNLIPSKESLPNRKKLPTVNIMEDPGIWVCLDEGCNSNCHGKEWAVNATAKLEKYMIKQ